MKVSSLCMVLKDGDFAEVLLNVDLSQLEANELGVNRGTILNLVYDDSGVCIFYGILEGADFIEFDLTEEEIKHVNQFIYDNGIYREVMAMFLEEKAS